jgi:peptidyl-prolyl cis-trans isomerase C
VRSKIAVCMLLTAVAVGTVSACRKAPAAQSAQTGTSGQAAASSTPPPAAPGAAPGGPGGSGKPPAAAPAKPVPAQLPEVIARVNGEEIKKAELDQIVHTMEARAGQAVPADRRDEIYRNAIDQLVVYKLLSQESKSRGIKVEESEIEAKIGQIRGQFPTQDAFDKALKDRGMSADSLRKDARVDLSVTKLMDAETATLPGPSDAEAKDFYAKNPDQFKEPEQVRASHILVRVDANADAAAKKKARGEIDSVLKQAKSGADFAKLAQQHSQDTSASQGGDLGYFPKGQMVPEFNKAAFELKPGQISDVVTTQFGYHVIKVVDHKPERVVPFEEAQAKIKDYLAGQTKQQHAAEFIQALKKKAKIEVLV